MKTAILTFVYAAVAGYFDEFCASIAAQTDRDFELLIFCDGWRPPPSTLALLTGITHRQIDVQGTPGSIRKQGLNSALDWGFEGLVLADSDDVHGTTRVAVSKRILSQSSIVVNELILFENGIPEGRKAFGERLLPEQRITAHDLRDKNCIGLSNAALRGSDRVRLTIASVPDENRVFDWCFFAHLLEMNVEARYTREAQTWYRQHDHNLAVLERFPDPQIKLAIEIKIEQYQALVHFSTWYSDREREFREILRRWGDDAEFRDRYARAVRSNARDGAFWWEPFIVIED